jgi:hypothetical protein
MDITQSKLTRSEWDSIEIPVSENEKKILKVIIDGYKDTKIKFNENLSIMNLLKIQNENNSSLNQYFYTTYFAKTIEDLLTKNKKKINTVYSDLKAYNEKHKYTTTINKIKKADLIRIQNMNSNIEKQRTMIFEFTLMDFACEIMGSLIKETDTYSFYLYTIIQFKKLSIENINTCVMEFVNFVITYATKTTNITSIFNNSYEFIEKNPHILKYQDIELYSHQKNLFNIMKKSPGTPKLVNYIAPTGTGKTMSPIGLATQYRIIFVCVARHVGLALAKSAISMGKKVAFAFGCETASDIRLHYFAAVSYSINHKSGGIHKVDNSIGTNVEIMICDVQSYLTAMHYMLAFNTETSIITYWDEPTITMDYDTHDLHEIIHKNWKENKISKVVLSCATLPTIDELDDTVNDFRMRFEGAEIHNIISHDCKKSICLMNKEGKVQVPHLVFPTYEEAKQSVEYCESHKAILRYFDLYEVLEFIQYVNKNGFVSERYKIESYYEKIEDITMDSIKTYYLTLLLKLKSSDWSQIHNELKNKQKPKFKVLNGESTPIKGVCVTTTDAHTLTDGPTIYLCEDVEKMGKFLVQQSKIPDTVFTKIMEKIEANEIIQQKLSILEKNVEDSLGKESEKEKKMEKNIFDKNTRGLMAEIELLQQQMQSVVMDPIYIPNTINHQKQWSPDGELVKNAYVSHVGQDSVKKIMETNTTNTMKLLLLLGIGVFTNNPDPKYIEIVKNLAYQQKLYLIIAQSDYIYGTNYQFCHGFIGKDLTEMTQQKTIQAIGRIGRNNIQQEYTIRFRDDTLIENLFKKMTVNKEAIIMNKLFSSN